MLDNLSAKKQKNLREGLKRIRELSKTKGERTGKLVEPDRAPRYDGLYAQDVAWLGRLADPESSEEDDPQQY